MLNISKFISDNVTFRQNSMFLADIEDNSEIGEKGGNGAYPGGAAIDPPGAYQYHQHQA